MRHSEATKQKISEKLKGYTQSYPHRENIGKSMTEMWSNNPERKQRYSEMNSKEKHPQWNGGPYYWKANREKRKRRWFRWGRKLLKSGLSITGK